MYQHTAGLPCPGNEWIKYGLKTNIKKFTWEKNANLTTKYILDYAKKNPDKKFIFKTKPGFSKNQINLVNSLNLKNCKLNLLGNFQNDKVQEMFKKFRFFFSTSLYEGNPKALLEAMSSGCIVFTTRNENSSEIIEDGENGFFIDENRDILGLISNLNDNLNYAQEITKNAYKTIEKNYLLKKIVDDEINIYKSLIF